jgi:hypothetical protein
LTRAEGGCYSDDATHKALAILALRRARVAQVRWRVRQRLYPRLRRAAPLALTAFVVVALGGALVVNLALIERIAQAASPALSSSAPYAQDQDRAWLSQKDAFLVRGTPSPPGGAQPPACGMPCSTYPTSYLLETRTVVNTLEPAKVGTDAAGVAYVDPNMSKLCGPGAAANTLAFWNDDILNESKTSFVDPSNGVTTTWDGQHNRAYVAYLAWHANVPDQLHAGMMDTHQPSACVTLYAMRDALNWEASGHAATTWRSYFYSISAWDRSSAADFHHKVLDDISATHVPVVAEVNARLLPNWTPEGSVIKHFITVVGYDDHAGSYYYTDSCGKSTGCGSLSDGGLLSIPQARLWDAITSTPVNTSRAYNAGDGGYVW